MNGIHSKIIAKAAKAQLGPLGFSQKGRSRLWIADHGSWLNVVEFTPSQWSKSVSLANAAHWLWVGAGFMSFNVSITSNCFSEFVDEEQFEDEVIETAKVAAANASEIETRFASFDAVADFLVERARSSPDRMAPSWWGYEAGIASGLLGRAGDAHHFLNGLTDERVIWRAAHLLPLIDNPAAFKGAVNRVVEQERARLKLAAMTDFPF